VKESRRRAGGAVDGPALRAAHDFKPDWSRAIVSGARHAPPQVRANRGRGPVSLRSRTGGLLGLSQGHFGFIRGLPTRRASASSTVADRLPLVLGEPVGPLPHDRASAGRKRDDKQSRRGPARIERAGEGRREQILAALEESGRAQCHRPLAPTRKSRVTRVPDVAGSSQPSPHADRGAHGPALVLSFRSPWAPRGSASFTFASPRSRSKPARRPLALRLYGGRTSTTPRRSGANPEAPRGPRRSTLGRARVVQSRSDLLGLRPGDVIDTQVSRASEIALVADGGGLGGIRRARRPRPKITRCEESS
jgi:hypothetical protein